MFNWGFQSLGTLLDRDAYVLTSTVDEGCRVCLGYDFRV